MNPIFSMEHLLLLAAVVIAGSAIVAWRTLSKCRPSLRALIAACRVCGLLCLAAIALNPGRWHQESEAEERDWAVLIDRSASMLTPDVAGRTRWDEAKRLAGKALELAEKPGRAHVFAFGDGIEPVSAAELSDLEAGGDTTDIVGAGRALLNRFGSRAGKLGGILLVSDGRQVAPGRAASLAIRARSREVPIYALPLGGEVESRDLAVSVGRRQYVTFVGQKVAVTASVANRGLGPSRCDVVLLDPEGEAVDTATVQVADGETAQARFFITPAAKGYSSFVVRTPGREGERTAANNEAAFGVVALESKMRVFVAEGTPYWDSKFLVQLLRSLPTVEINSVYRVAADRFFRIDTDAADAFDPGDDTFPGDTEAMAGYDVVLFGRGAEYFLTPERGALLHEFVRDQGGCVIFARGKPSSVELDELRILEPVSWGAAIRDEFRFLPTPDGEDVGLFGEMLPGREDGVWDRLPMLSHAHSCSRLKAFAQVLVEGTYERAGKTRSFPLVVSRRYGRGLVLVVNAEGLWQWDFFPSVGEAGNMYREIWTQLFQWAVTYSEFLPGQEYSLRLSRATVTPGEPVHARVRRRGEGAGAQPGLRVRRGDEVIQERVLAGADDRWEAIVALDEPGPYRVELVSGDDGATLGPRATLAVLAPPTEGDNLSADAAFLEQLADESGGRLIGREDLAEVVRDFEPAAKPIDLNKATWQPGWDTWWFLCLVLLCFSGEWFVRRRNGLL